MAIIAANERVDASQLFGSVEATFIIRGTHPIPHKLAEPPATWEQPFATIAAEAAKLPVTGLREGYALAAHFWDPFLAGEVAHQVWWHDLRRWAAAPTSSAQT